MAYFYRVTFRSVFSLVAVLCLIAAALYVGSAHAAFSPGLEYSVVSPPWYSSKTAACQARLSSYAYAGATTATVSGSTCTFTNASGGFVTGLNISQRTASCPANSTGTTTCTCTAPYVETAGACAMPVSPGEAHCNSIVGSAVKTSWTSSAPSLGTRNVCVSGGSGYNCNATIEPDFCGSSDGKTYVCHGAGVSASGACIPSATPEQPIAPPQPASELPNPPPPGTCPGEMNGVSLNVPCSRTETKGTKTTTEDDGAGKTTTKTEAKSTSCTAAGSCTTTVTTTTTVNGTSTTSTKTTTEGKGEFCAGNPGSKECGDGEGSSFGGSCQAGFTCDGDALQCAIAKEQHKRSCELFEKDNEERQAYEAAKVKGKAGTDQTADLPGNQTINIGPGDFDSSDAIGGSQCITDKTLVISGHTVSIPLSTMCPYLAYLGQLLVVVGYLLGARILIRG
jgi:hypothetical protein